MRYSIVFFFFLILLSFSACNSSDSSKRSTKQKSLPDSAGQIDEVLVVMDDNEWKGELGKVIREILAEDYPGLPQIEPRFDLVHIPFKAFKNLFRRSSTIVFVSPSNCETDLCNHVKEAFSHYSKQGSDFLISFKDVYARPQKVIYLSAPDASGLASNILVNNDRILKAVSEVENNKAYRAAYASRTNESFSEVVKKYFHLDCPIPKSYRRVVDTDSLIWFRQDIEGAVSNLVFHVKQLPSGYNDDFDLPSFAMQARNEYGKEYVLSETKGSYMVIDTVFSPIQEKHSIDNKAVLESRGLWYLSKDYMGGPFLNYAYVDEARQKVILMDAWVYAPQFKKRPQIRRLEEIMNRVKFL